MEINGSIKLPVESVDKMSTKIIKFLDSRNFRF